LSELNVINFSVCLIDGASCHNAFTFYLDWTSLSFSLGIGALICSSIVNCNKC